MSITVDETTPSPTVVMLTCPDCGNTLESGYFDLAVYEHSHTMVCDECTNDHYHKCEGCSHWVHDDEVTDVGTHHYHAWMCDGCLSDFEIFITESEEEWSA